MKNIALVGNPNSGKTTVFNALTGSNQYVGNWPGVTVEKKEGTIKYKDKEYNLVDLPGTYSLGAFSEDEVVARDFILNGDPEIIINVVDATNLERNLYLTTQLLEMDKKVVIALNMMDEAKEKGIEIDVDKLSTSLGLPVVTTIASKRRGIDELIETTVKNMDVDYKSTKPNYGDLIYKDFREIRNILDKYDLNQPLDWLVIKSLESDKDVLKLIEEKISNEDFNMIVKIAESNEDYELDIIDARYTFIKNRVKSSIKRPEVEKETFTDRVDKIVTHKFWGIPIFAFIMFLIFQLTFTIGEDVFGEFIANSLDVFADWVYVSLLNIGAPDLFVSFISGGIIPGLAAVFEFIPLIVILYFFIGILEDSGYMARVAYVMDGLMRSLGLQGKAFIPMIVGFGCNVPGIMATRTLENSRDRMISILINPFMSCGAKLPIYLMFTAAFFPDNGGLVLFALYALGILLALIMAKVFSNTLFKGEATEFIMELPPYRVPSLRSVLRDMWDKVWDFIHRAGTIIFVVISILWLLANLPFGVEEYSQASLLGRIGTFIAPIFKYSGFGNWQAAVALFSGIIAKETVVSTLGMVYAGVSEGAGLVSALQVAFTPLSAVSFMVLVLLYTPCVAALGAVRRETNSVKWTIFTAVYTFVIGLVASILVYQIGLLLGFS